MIDDKRQETLHRDKWRRYMGDVTPATFVAGLGDLDSQEQIRYRLEERFFGDDTHDAEGLIDLAADLAEILERLTGEGHAFEMERDR
jgi:hypothetical protein